MTSYKKKFDIYDIDTAQILLTEEGFDLTAARNYLLYGKQTSGTLFTTE